MKSDFGKPAKVGWSKAYEKAYEDLKKHKQNKEEKEKKKG